MASALSKHGVQQNPQPYLQHSLQSQKGKTDEVTDHSWGEHQRKECMRDIDNPAPSTTKEGEEEWDEEDDDDDGDDDDDDDDDDEML